MEVRLLGGFAVSVGGVDVTRWRAGKARSLMQYLVTRRNTIVSREALNEVLWPGEAKSSNYCSLKVAAHALRKALADEVFLGQRAPARVEFQDFGYILRAPDAWIDIEAFQAHARAGFEAEERGDEALAGQEYRQAAGLYHGDFLPGEDALWVVEQQVWLRAVALKVFQRLARVSLQAGDEFEAIEWCRRAVDLDPCNEKTYQTLMHLHGRSGELGMALKWYSLCEWRLREDLGVQVSEATRRALVSIVQRNQPVAGSPSLARVRTAAVGPPRGAGEAGGRPRRDRGRPDAARPRSPERLTGPRID